jgi:hypothetical protein
MSWGFEFRGTKEDVKAQVAAYCDKAAANYAGKPEADDVIAVRDRVLLLVDAIALDEKASAVLAKGNGSHSTDNGQVAHAQANFQVNRALPA